MSHVLRFARLHRERPPGNQQSVTLVIIMGKRLLEKTSHEREMQKLSSTPHHGLRRLVTVLAVLTAKEALRGNQGFF